MLSNYRLLKASYYNSRKEEFDRKIFWHRYVYRLLSFLPTAACLELGLSANTVTITRFVSLAPICVLMSTPSYSLRIGAACLYFAYYVFDFVDGNIARFQKSSSFFGKLIDGAIDSFNRIIFIPLAVGMDRSHLKYLTQSQLVTAATLLFIAVLVADQFRFRVLALRLELENTRTSSPALPSDTSGKAAIAGDPTKTRGLQFGKRALDEIHEAIPAILILTTAFQLEEAVITFFAFTHITGNLAEIGLHLRKAKNTFNVQRTI